MTKNFSKSSNYEIKQNKASIVHQAPESLAVILNKNPECATENECAYALGIQYTNIKYRLDEIEMVLNKMNQNLNSLLATIKPANSVSTASKSFENPVLQYITKNNNILFLSLLIAWLLVALFLKNLS